MQAAGLSHFLEELEEVIAIGVYNKADNTEEGGGEEGRVSAAQKQILLMYQQHTLALLPSIPQSHTNLEVLNATFM